VILGFRRMIRNRVVTESSRERMATREARHAEPGAAADSEAFDSLVGVLRAGGFKATGSGEEYGKVGFVAAQREKSSTNSEGRHSMPAQGVLRSFRSSVVSAAKGAVATLGLG
jgi:hypothetical protein